MTITQLQMQLTNAIIAHLTYKLLLLLLLISAIILLYSCYSLRFILSHNTSLLLIKFRHFRTNHHNSSSHNDRTVSSAPTLNTLKKKELIFFFLLQIFANEFFGVIKETTKRVARKKLIKCSVTKRLNTFVFGSVVKYRQWKKYWGNARKTNSRKSNKTFWLRFN